MAASFPSELDSMKSDSKPDEASGASGEALDAVNTFQSNAHDAATTFVLNEHNKAESTANEEIPTPEKKPHGSTSADDANSSTSNEVLTAHFANLRCIKDIITKHRGHFQANNEELDHLIEWLTNLIKQESDYRLNPGTSLYVIELMVGNLLDKSELQDMIFILFEKREDKDAGELYQKIYNRLKATNGENHVSAITIEVLIARCFFRHDFEHEEKIADYVEIFKNAYQRMCNIFGESHVGTLGIEYFLAWSLWLNSKQSEALELAEKVYKVQASVMGPESTESLRTQVLISRCLYNLGRIDDSTALALALFDKQHQFLDSTDSETLFVKYMLSYVLRFVGKYNEALSLAEDIYKTQKESLAAGHIAMLQTQRLIGLCLVDLKKYEEGLAVLELVFEGRKNILGLDHRHTLISQQDVSWGNELLGEKVGSI